MKKWRAFVAFLRRHPWVAAILGFLSVYFVWAIPALPTPFLNWGEWFSYAYTYGDYLVLPLFNAVSFWMIAKANGRIPKWSLGIVLPAGLFILFFEPDASAALKAGEISSLLRIYHSGFVFLEFSFILFMLTVYCFSWWSWAYAPLPAATFLFLMVGVFLGFVHIADAWFHDFGFLERIIPGALLLTAYIFLLLDHKFHFFQKLIRSVKRH